MIFFFYLVNHITAQEREHYYFRLELVLTKKFEQISVNNWGGGGAVPWHRYLVAGFSLWRPGFAPRAVHVGFVVDKMALQQVFLQVLQFSHQYHSTAAPYFII
jgi:hypothetical protein